MPITKTTEKVDINKRRIINGADADVIQLYPMRHLFAWEAYNTGNTNHQALLFCTLFMAAPPAGNRRRRASATARGS